MLPGIAIIFIGIYPASISDSENTENCGAIEIVEEKHEIMSFMRFIHPRVVYN